MDDRDMLAAWLDDYDDDIKALTGSLAGETRVQSPVELYQRLKKWYLMAPCLTLSIIM